MAGQQWASDRLARQLAARPCRNPALAQEYEAGTAITHRARQAPTGPLARIASCLSKFGPRKRWKVDAAEARDKRRKWGGSSSMPDKLRPHYSEAERAALAVIADQVKRHGFCELPLEKIAEMAGVSRTTAQNAIRKARGRDRSDISVQLRPQPGRKNLTNVIRIISLEWLRWIKRSIGFKALNPSERSRKTPLSQGAIEPKMAFETEEVAFYQAEPQPKGVDGWWPSVQRSSLSWIGGLIHG